MSILGEPGPDGDKVGMSPGMHIQVDSPHSFQVVSTDTHVVLRVEHATGMNIFSLTPDNADTVGVALRAQASVVRAKQIAKRQ